MCRSRSAKVVHEPRGEPKAEREGRRGEGGRRFAIPLKIIDQTSLLTIIPSLLVAKEKATLKETEKERDVEIEKATQKETEKERDVEIESI